MSDVLKRKPNRRLNMKAERKAPKTSKAVSTKVCSLARKVFLANKEKNRNAREEKEYMGELTRMVTDFGVTSAETSVTYDGRKYEIKVHHSSGRSSTSVDVEALINLVPAEELVKIASFSGTRIKDTFGKVIYDKVCSSVPGPKRISVDGKEAKKGA